MAAKTETGSFRGSRSEGLHGAPSMVVGVTAATYAGLARAFAAQAGSGFIAVQRKGQFEPTPRQWAAWRAYLHRIGYPLQLFDSREYYTVPAEWPHLFDASATVADDEQAANAHMDVLRRQSFSRPGAVSAEVRKAVVASRLGYDPSKRRPATWRPEREEAEPKYIDKAALFESADAAIAAMEAKEAARRAA